MAVTYGFFNSVNGDRKYNAEQMSEYFRGIVNEGVFQHLDGGLAVTAGTGLAVSVASGRAIIQNRWVQNSDAMTLSISAASETYARKDAVVIRLNYSTRSIEIAVKAGTPAASPSAPSMTRNSTTYEMALAYVNVAANATSVTITDKRSDSTVCGWATVAQATSGEVDAQLNAMKTGFDGVVYNSPGDAVRGCDKDLQDCVANLMPVTSSFALDIQFTKTGKYVIPSSGGLGGNASFTASDYFPVNGIKSFVQSGVTSVYYAFYKKDKTYLSGGPTNGITGIVTVPDGAWYMRTSTATADLSNYVASGFYNQNDVIDTKILAGLSNVGLRPNTDLLNRDTVLTNKYVIYNNGAIATANGYFCSDLIEISRGCVISAYPVNQYALYDKDGAYVTGAIGSPQDGVNIINIPVDSTACYIRFCGSSANLANAYFKIQSNKSFFSDVYHITTSEGILDGVMSAYAAGAAEIVVEKGSYDLIAEYKAKYGDSYFDNYTTNYNGRVHGNYDMGVWLKNIKITFAQNAFVSCLYTGSNDNVKTYFSAFAVGGNVEIEGLNLNASNLRYGLHPDYNPATYSRFVMRGCDLKEEKSTDNRAIGAGLGPCCDWTFEDCIFRTPSGAESGTTLVSIHNNLEAGAKSIVTFKNCYVDGDGKISLRWFGQSSEVTNVFICGCSYETEPELKAETGGQPYENVALIKIGNELRTA